MEVEVNQQEHVSDELPETHRVMCAKLFFLILIPFGILALYGISVLFILLLIALLALAVLDPTLGFGGVFWLLLPSVVPAILAHVAKRYLHTQARRFQHRINGFQLHDDGIQFVGNNTKKVLWNEIVEIRHEKNQLSFNSPCRKQNESKEAFHRRWNEDISKIVLIGRDDKVLLTVRGSSFKEYPIIRNEIVSRVDDALGYPSRNMENEKQRALRLYRFYQKCLFVLSIVFAVVSVVFLQGQLQWDAQTNLLESDGIHVSAQILQSKQRSEGRFDIKYQFQDAHETPYTSSFSTTSESWESHGKPREITVVFSPIDPSVSRPVDLDIDSAYTFKLIRIFILFLFPAFVLWNLFTTARDFFSNNYHYKTDFYTAVKHGKPKPNQ